MAVCATHHQAMKGFKRIQQEYFKSSLLQGPPSGGDTGGSGDDDGGGFPAKWFKGCRVKR